jgi:hypothetical protein
MMRYPLGLTMPQGGSYKVCNVAWADRNENCEKRGVILRTNAPLARSVRPWVCSHGRGFPEDRISPSKVT